MFGMGLSEIFFIVVIAVLFLGPDKLPDTMIQIAKFFRSIKRTVNDAKSSLEEELKISELKEEALKYKKQLDDATHQLERATTADLTTLEELTETVEDVKKAETRLEEEAEEIKEKIEPKRETVTFPKKRRPNRSVYAPEDDSNEKEANV
ncbi:Sec-independent protein translocase protein TatB [Hydrogenimonas urashimensis]|uniref:Sec-independent protein translocase protein TatB n=1 Tax=Hydrogenimonas urashimensis TaxID=2740515 RepID=UPI0019153678|nr:Sec-independent protein translocase protein TatB [Hydrogenimonas urashimensis]